MKMALLSPLFAFSFYFVVVALISRLGSQFSATGRKTEAKTAPYASGEKNESAFISHSYMDSPGHISQLHGESLHRPILRVEKPRADITHSGSVDDGTTHDVWSLLE